MHDENWGFWEGELKFNKCIKYNKQQAILMQATWSLLLLAAITSRDTAAKHNFTNHKWEKEKKLATQLKFR